MPPAAAGVAIGLTAVQGLSSMNAARQAAKAGKASSLRNALIAEYAAQDALRRGGIEASKVRARGRKVMGAQRTIYGASGVVVDQGTPLDVAIDTAANTELDALTIENNAARQAWGHREQAEQFAYRARMESYAGTQQMIGIGLGMGAQIAGIAGSGVFKKTPKTGDPFPFGAGPEGVGSALNPTAAGGHLP